MRIEIGSSTVGEPLERPPERPVTRGRQRIDPFELGLLGVLGLLSLWVLALDLYQVIAHGRVWTGTDGFFIVDQLQYLAWIRDASHHLLSSNLFVLRATPADYFQPAIAISGGITALGVAPWVSLLLWKPVAVVAIFYGARAYVHRSLGGLWERRAALTLALFFASFSIVYGSFSVVGDLFPTFLSWGYPFALLAVGAILVALVSYDRGRQSDKLTYVPAVLGAIASSLHPWQGETLIVLVIASELLLIRDPVSPDHRLRLAAVTVIGTGLPLLYYFILGHADLSWSLARDASKHSFEFWAIALALAPLALAAMLGYRRRPRTFLAGATRIWPFAAIVIYLFSASGVSATPLHAFDGVTVPLAVLAVQGLQWAGWRRVPHRRIVAGVAIAAGTIPATSYLLSISSEFTDPTANNANFIKSDEGHALAYLHTNADKGGVLTRAYLGAMVPEATGRRTFVGTCLWSQPGCLTRGNLARQLFQGQLSTTDARTFVEQTGARFVLADCQTTVDLTAVLSPMLSSVHRFGCASVYELQPPSPPNGPLAELPPDAAVRAPRRQ